MTEKSQEWIKETSEDKYAFDQGLYIDQCLLFINFMLRKKQWSGINSADYQRWLNNFNQIENGKYIAMRILDALLYYSEDDIIKMLDDILMQVFESDVVLPLQKERNFSCLSSEIEYAVNQAISKTIVMPSIEDFKDPGASGPEIIRLVRNHFNPQIHTIFNDKYTESMQYDRIIIIDDCIGSGEQCETFWTRAQIQSDRLLKDWVQETGIKAFYIALVGYKKAVQNLRAKFPELTILCAEYVDDQHQVFSQSSKCWNNESEQKMAEKTLKTRIEEHGISFLGFSDMSFAVVLHKTIPDWSLPLLYKNKNDWKHLIERKNTYD